MLCVNISVGIGLIISSWAAGRPPASVIIGFGGSVAVEEPADHALLADYVSLRLLL